jgi:hypothetical protein
MFVGSTTSKTYSRHDDGHQSGTTIDTSCKYTGGGGGGAMQTMPVSMLHGGGGGIHVTSAACEFDYIVHTLNVNVEKAQLYLILEYNIMHSLLYYASVNVHVYSTVLHFF